CGLVIWFMAPRAWMRVFGVLYPLTTTFVVMATANHYILDAVGGAAVISVGLAVQYALTGRGPFTDAVPPPVAELPAQDADAGVNADKKSIEGKQPIARQMR
ncbi:MAG: hypothetical protein HOV68_26055, partial [Streptomycetaceae bacterium]|nr:hypothetical protein [Streptomycetaceae bacterium]